MARADFEAAYAAALRERAAHDPDYSWALFEGAFAEQAAARMTISLAAGHADVHGSPVLRALAKRYGFAHTLAGWRAFAGGLT